jgi:hypothetical protein
MIQFKQLNSGLGLSNLNKSKEAFIPPPIELDFTAFNLPNEEELDESAKKLLFAVKSLMGQ